MDETDTSKLVDAIIHESEQVQSGIERAQNGIYTSFGVILPAIFALFLLGSDHEKAAFSPPLIAAILIIAVALGGMWSQSLWVELFRYTLYKHRCLLPRLYAATGQSRRRNFLEIYGRRSLFMKLPINLFNLGVLTVLVGAYFAFVLEDQPPNADGFQVSTTALGVVTAIFILALVVSTLAVMVEGGKLEKEFRKERGHDDC